MTEHRKGASGQASHGAGPSQSSRRPAPKLANARGDDRRPLFGGD